MYTASSMRRTAGIALLLGLLLAVAPAQTPLTNEAIVKMVKAGLGDDIILTTIKAQPAQYAITPDDLIALKCAGVGEKLIAAMTEKAGAGSPAPYGNPLAAPRNLAAAVSPVVGEVGVYYNKNGRWADLPPEVVNFKTSGVLKTIGTAWIVKRDVNGHLNGVHSPNQLKTPVEL